MAVYGAADCQLRTGANTWLTSFISMQIGCEYSNMYFPAPFPGAMIRDSFEILDGYSRSNRDSLEFDANLGRSRSILECCLFLEWCFVFSRCLEVLLGFSRFSRILSSCLSSFGMAAGFYEMIGRAFGIHGIVNRSSVHLKWLNFRIQWIDLTNCLIWSRGYAEPHHNRTQTRSCNWFGLIRRLRFAWDWFECVRWRSWSDCWFHRDCSGGGQGDGGDRITSGTSLWHQFSSAGFPLSRPVVQERLRLPHLQVSPSQFESIPSQISSKRLNSLQDTVMLGITLDW